jgi:hypothetical protein
MKDIAKQMILNTIERIVKNNLKAAKFFKAGGYSQDDVKTFHKKVMMLCYILYPEIEAVRAFIEKEHPEYKYIVDFVEDTVKEHERTEVEG